MKWYPWLTEYYQQLVKLYSSGKEHHALLLHSLPGIGSNVLVEGVGRWLMCHSPNEGKTCGVCHGCRLMMAGNHPDWHVLRPEKEKSSLGVEQVRTAMLRLYAHSQQGGRKVIWLPEAESLTEASANALLKTLEEPPANTFFIFECRDFGNIIATIRSRCMQWMLSVPSENYTFQWLKRQYPQIDEILLISLIRVGRGAPLAAEYLLQPEMRKQREKLFQTLQQCIEASSLVPLLPVLNTDNAVQCLYWLYTLLLDSCKWMSGIRQYTINQDQSVCIQMLAEQLPLSVIHSTMQTLLLCSHQLDTVSGVNRELVIAERLFYWEEQWFR